MQTPIAALLDLAERRETGVLQFPNGGVHLAEGAVTQVVCSAVPGFEKRATGALSRIQRHILMVDVAADAALELFAETSAAQFTPGPEHLAPLERPLRASTLLDEIARRRRVLAAVADRSRPDEPVTRTDQLPVGRVKLTAHQWDLVRLADTPRRMAHQLGTGVFTTTVDVAALVQAGLLNPVVVTGREPNNTPFLDAVSGS